MLLFSFSQLVALGCLQGIIIALYLFGKAGVSRILAIYVALIAINMGVSFYIDTGLFKPPMHFISLWSSLNSYLLLGPVLLFFVLYMTNAKRQWHWKDSLHFLPFILFLGMSAHSFINVTTNELLTLQSISNQLQQVTEQSLTERFSLVYLLPAAHFISYLIVASILVLRFFYKRKRNTALQQLNWIITVLALSHLMMLSLFIVLIVSIINGITQSTDTFTMANFSTVLFFFGFTYLLIRFGRPTPESSEQVHLINQQKETVNGQSITLKEGLVDEQTTSAHVTKKPAIKELSEQVELDEEQQQQLNEIDALMVKEKYYLNSRLTQQELAEALSLSRHQLSLLLSHHQAGNFYELINQYRVSAVVKAMKSRPLTDNLINIAYDCGFSSKSSFNQVFKKYKAKTPSQYRKYIRLTDS